MQYEVVTLTSLDDAVIEESNVENKNMVFNGTAIVQFPIDENLNDPPTTQTVDVPMVDLTVQNLQLIGRLLETYESSVVKLRFFTFQDESSCKFGLFFFTD